ncbi:SDR family NAD(P)-dependent oxidoreductase [Saccharopolyspora sp. K220]|nr:SDR family NAD(P)-dependent oxidoreductase [Saccharopolyspora soli]
MFETDFFAVLTVLRAALPALRESGGRIVHISSFFGQAVWPGSDLYSATNSALELLSDTLAVELAPIGVREYLSDSRPTAQWAPRHAVRLAVGPSSSSTVRPVRGHPADAVPANVRRDVVPSAELLPAGLGGSLVVAPLRSTR